MKECCEAEQRNHDVLIPINNVHNRVAIMTGTYLGIPVMWLSLIHLEIKILYAPAYVNNIPYIKNSTLVFSVINTIWRNFTLGGNS